MREERRQDRVEARSGTASAERGIRDGLDEIRDAIDRLEQYCRQGRITPVEFAEERDLLEAQRAGLRRAR